MLDRMSSTIPTQKYRIINLTKITKNEQGVEDYERLLILLKSLKSPSIDFTEIYDCNWMPSMVI